MAVEFVNDHLYMQVRGVGEPPPKPGKTSKAPPHIVLKVVSVSIRRSGGATASPAPCWSSARGSSTASVGTALRSDEMLTATRRSSASPRHAHRPPADRPPRTRVRAVGEGRQSALPVGPVVRPPCRTTPRRLPRVGHRRRRRPCADGRESPASMVSRSSSRASAAACERAGVRPSTIDDVRTASPEAAAELQAYLDEHGWRGSLSTRRARADAARAPQRVGRRGPDGGEGRWAATVVIASERGRRALAGAGTRPFRFDELLADAPSRRVRHSRRQRHADVPVAGGSAATRDVGGRPPSDGTRHDRRT